MHNLAKFDNEPAGGSDGNPRHWVRVYSQMLRAVEVMLTEDLAEPARL